MKTKPIYIYLGVFVIFIVAVIFFSNKVEEKQDNPNSMSGQMPNDDIHKGMRGGDVQGPSKSNVTESVKQKLEKLKSAYEKNPNDTLKVREYADILTMAHQPDKAEELYEKLLKTDSKRIDVLLQLTFLNFNEDNLDKAEDYTNRILKIDGNHPAGLFNLGVIAAAKGDKNRAKSIWEGLVKKYPKTNIGYMAEESLKQLDKN